MILQFLCGILFYDLLMPLLDSIFGAIYTKIERIKAKDALEIAKINSEINKLSDCPQIKGPIGFVSTNEETLEKEDEDEYDD